MREPTITSTVLVMDPAAIVATFALGWTGQMQRAAGGALLARHARGGTRSGLRAGGGGAPPPHDTLGCIAVVSVFAIPSRALTVAQIPCRHDDHVEQRRRGQPAEDDAGDGLTRAQRAACVARRAHERRSAALRAAARSRPGPPRPDCRARASASPLRRRHDLSETAPRRPGRESQARRPALRGNEVMADVG